MLLLLLKHSIIFYRIDRSINKKYLCEPILYNTITCFLIAFFKDVF